MATIMNIEGLQAINRQDLITTAQVATDESDNTSFDAKLTRVDISQRIDCYFNLQMLQMNNSYYVYSHSGRTGSDGDVSVRGPFTKPNALHEFNKLYSDKTGNSWANKNIGGQPTSSELYQHLSTLTRNAGRAQNGKWEYYLKDDHPANGGKPDGWYPYDEKAGNEVEQLYLDRADNASLVTRFVYSDTSGYTYKVDLATLSQTNTTSNKRRPIRRIGGKAVDVPFPKTVVRSRKLIALKHSNKLSSKSNAQAAPKKKKTVKGKKPAAEMVVPPPPPPVITTLNLRQQYCKGLLSDRSARKYLRSIGESQIQ